MMSRFAAFAAAALLGSTTLLPPYAAAALILTQDATGDVFQVSTSNTTADVLQDQAKIGNASPDRGGLSSSSLAFSGVVVTPSPVGTVKLNGGDVMFADIATSPLPAAVWLFGSAFLGLCWLGRRSGMRGVGILPKY